MITITHRGGDDTGFDWKNWHLLTVGESGFSILDIHARGRHGLDVEVIRRFAERINSTDEAGTLHPLAPVSAIPSRFFRTHADSMDPRILRDFRQQIEGFIAANREVIRSARVVVDFRVGTDPVPSQYLRLAEEVFRSPGCESPIIEVVLVP